MLSCYCTCASLVIWFYIGRFFCRPKYESMWGYGFNSVAYLGKCYSSCIPVQVVDGGCGWRSRYALGYHTTSHHITDLLMLTVFGCGALSGMMRSLVLQVS